jgi:hypothetical protein
MGRPELAANILNTRGMRVAFRRRYPLEGDFALLTCSEHLALFLDSGSALRAQQQPAISIVEQAKMAMVHHHARKSRRNADQ